MALQIGNAVPPHLAQQIGLTVAKMDREALKRERWLAKAREGNSRTSAGTGMKVQTRR